MTPNNILGIKLPFLIKLQLVLTMRNKYTISDSFQNKLFVSVMAILSVSAYILLLSDFKRIISSNIYVAFEIIISIPLFYSLSLYGFLWSRITNSYRFYILNFLEIARVGDKHRTPIDEGKINSQEKLKDKKLLISAVSMVFFACIELAISMFNTYSYWDITVLLSRRPDPSILHLYFLVISLFCFMMIAVHRYELRWLKIIVLRIRELNR